MEAGSASSARVKILDFGLAKALTEDGEGADSSLSQSPTMTLAATMRGEILGTAGYMSPEQVQGDPADSRADIWAFGICLLEALVGRPVFQGENLSTILAAVLRDDVDLTRLPADTPTQVRRLLDRCLVKKPDDRLHHIGDARVELRAALEAPTFGEDAPSGAAARPRIAGLLAAGAVAGAVIAGIAVGTFKSAPGPSASRSPLTYVSVLIPPKTLLLEGPGSSVALSADGRRLVFGAYDAPEDHLFYRDLGEPTSRPLADTEAARAPVFSPDGAWVAFFADNELRKIAVEGGPPVSLQSVPGTPSGAVWLRDDTIIYGDRGGVGLARIPASGGETQEVTFLEEGELDHRWPGVSLDGRVLLYTSWRGSLDNAVVVAQSLETGERREVTQGTQPKMSPGGHLIFARRDSLWAVRFDTESLTTIGSERPVSDEVSVMGAGAAHYDVSADGSLAFASGLAGLNLQLKRISRDGSRLVVPWLSDRDWFTSLKLSRQTGRLVIGRGNPGSPDLWVYDVDRGSGRRVETSAFSGVWGPRGENLVFARSRGADRESIWRWSVDGSSEAELLLGGDLRKIPTSWSPDGAAVLYNEDDPETGIDIEILHLADGSTSTFLETASAEESGTFSPDGRWVAYASDESGDMEVYVRPYPGPGAKHGVSIGGGRFPVWSWAGDELFYLGDTGIMAVAVDGARGFEVGRPELLFEVATHTSSGGYVDSVFAPCADDDCFYVVSREEAATPPALGSGMECRDLGSPGRLGQSAGAAGPCARGAAEAV